MTNEYLDRQTVPPRILSKMQSLLIEKVLSTRLIKIVYKLVVSARIELRHELVDICVQTRPVVKAKQVLTALTQFEYLAC